MAGDIRQPIDLDALTQFVESNVPEIELPISIKQFGFGQSNPTYQLTAANGIKYVMRKKPPGRLLSRTAHRVDREYRIIHSLERTDVPVPKAYVLCEDDNVIGTPFYIMEFLDGRIFEDAAFPDVAPEERTEMWHDAIRTLGKLHRIDPATVKLEKFGLTSSFYNRQVKTLSTISESQAKGMDIESKEVVGKIPHFDDMISFFRDPQTQPQDRATLVHGDYKIDNLVYHKTEPRVIGILDWEMSTIGHPLSDLSNLLTPYTFAMTASPATSPLRHRTNPAFYPSSQTPGLPTRAQCMEWYAETAGWDPQAESAWGDAFGCFRNSVIMQGIAARYAVRQASSAKAKEHGMEMGPFGEFAWRLVGACKNGVGVRSRL